MRRKYRTMFKCLIISLCLMAAGLVLYFFAGRIAVNHIYSDLNYAIVSGQSKVLSNSGVKIDMTQKGSKQENAENNTSSTDKSGDSISVISEEDWIEPTIGEQYATLSCESIELNVPVYCGDTDEILEKGVGQSAHSSFPGHKGVTLIGGHDTTFFAPLENLKENDEVVLSTTYGKYTYKVSKKTVINGVDIDLNSKEDKLILYTCYPFGEIMKDRNNKILFECSLVEGPSIGGGTND